MRSARVLRSWSSERQRALPEAGRGDFAYFVDVAHFMACARGGSATTVETVSIHAKSSLRPRG